DTPDGPCGPPFLTRAEALVLPATFAPSCPPAAVQVNANCGPPFSFDSRKRRRLHSLSLALGGPAVQVRPFQVADADEVIALWHRAGLARPWNDPRRDIERKLLVQPELFLVAVLDGGVVGTVMAGYDGHRGWINYLGVDPDHQRRGIGRALMA